MQLQGISWQNGVFKKNLCVTCGAHQNTSRKQLFVRNDNTQGEQYFSGFLKEGLNYRVSHGKMGFSKVYDASPAVHTRTHLENQGRRKV